jgi:hypothetical protein
VRFGVEAFAANMPAISANTAIKAGVRRAMIRRQKKTGRSFNLPAWYDDAKSRDFTSNDFLRP